MPGRNQANVEVISFGYGHKAPPAAHLLFDVRFHFRDPHFDPALREMTAEDPRVTRAVMATPGVLKLLGAMSGAVLAYRAAPSPGPLTVAVGCTGGRHRSAVIAGQLAERLVTAGIPATVTHRDMRLPVITR